VAAVDDRFTPMPAVPRSPDEARAFALDEEIWLLRVPLAYPAASSVNAVLLKSRDGYVLVDCGSSLAPGWEGLACALGRAGVAPGDVSVLITTHDHSDHSGLALEVIDRTGCEYVRLDAPLSLTDGLRQVDRPLAERGRLARELGIPEERVDVFVDTHVAGDGRHIVATPDGLLHEGDVIEAAGGSWVVVPGAGHCASQLMLHDERRRWLISADVALRAPVPFVEWGHTPDPLGDHLHSILRVRDLEPSLLLTGHGRPVSDVSGQIAYALDAAARVRDRVVELVAAGPATPYEVLCRFVPENADLDQRQAGLSTVLSALDHLERRGDVQSVVGAAGVRTVCAVR
jgi:glyoxylase-like metal-dependent hydrolase (beta-lactamase superfamily II)